MGGWGGGGGGDNKEGIIIRTWPQSPGERSGVDSHESPGEIRSRLSRESRTDQK